MVHQGLGRDQGQHRLLGRESRTPKIRDVSRLETLYWGGGHIECEFPRPSCPNHIVQSTP